MDKIEEFFSVGENLQMSAVTLNTENCNFLPPLQNLGLKSPFWEHYGQN